MHNPNKSGLENDCKELFSAFQGVLSWKWDSRFETVLAEFRAGNKGSIRPILRKTGNTAQFKDIDGIDGRAPCCQHRVYSIGYLQINLVRQSIIILHGL